MSSCTAFTASKPFRHSPTISTPPAAAEVLAQQRPRRLLVVHDHDPQRPGRGEASGRGHGGRGAVAGVGGRVDAAAGLPQVRQQVGGGRVPVRGGLGEAAVEDPLRGRGADAPRPSARRRGAGSLSTACSVSTPVSRRKAGSPDSIS